jgi:hypothetical protein
MSGISLKLFSVKGKRQKARNRTLSSSLFILYSLFFFSACATKMVGMPPAYDGVDLKDALTEREKIKSIHSTFSIEFEKNGNTMKGDAVLQMNSDLLDLQIYSLGFLVAEVVSDNTMTRSDPPLDRNRLSMLVDGLRSSFFWWNIKKPDIADHNDAYILSNSWRMVYINKRTMLPSRQTIDIEDGMQLSVYYEEPVSIDGIWFPSNIRIELSRYSVAIKVKTLSVNPQ